MFESTSKRTAKHPKLRSSCDACGNAKLKCDRAQPECGRCVSLAQPCVYSISKKTGRTARSSKQLANQQSTAAEVVDNDPPSDVMGTPAAPSAFSDNLDATIRPSAGDWDPPHSRAEEMITSMTQETLDEMQLDRFLQHTDWSSLRLDDNLSSDPQQPQTLSGMDMSNPELYGNGGLPPKAAMASSQQFVFDDVFPPTPVSQTQAQCNKAQTCYEEAYDLLGKLSAEMPSENTSTSSTTAAPTTSANTNSPIPLDYVLRMSRETTERLGRLLTCCCSSSSQNVVLYASILSRILLWYRQAVGAEPSPHHPYGCRMNEFEFRRGSSHASLSTMGSCWSSPAGGSINPSAAGLSSTSLLSNPAGPTSQTNSYITVGSFKVDDRQVQMAVEMQLLAGELRRTGNLVDLFTTQNLEGLDEMTFHDVDVLYRCLGLWLKREYLRISDILRSRLIEVSQ